MTEKNTAKIRRALGNYLEVDVGPLFGLACKKFIRIKVEIDITKPLKQGLSKSSDFNFDTWVLFTYERFSNF